MSDYSVRRNIGKGPDTPLAFLLRIKELGFFRSVLEGKIDAIDNVSDILKECEITNKRRTVSLLSKTAYLINPHKFVLYDTLARTSIYNEFKKKKNMRGVDLNQYSIFINHVHLMIDEFDENKKFSEMDKILKEFSGTSAFNFFMNNKSSLKLRVIDKYLWILGQSKDNRLDNSSLIDFIKLGDSVETYCS